MTRIPIAMFNTSQREKFSHPIQALIILDSENPIRRADRGRNCSIETDLERYVFWCAKGLNVVGTAFDKAEYSIDLLRLAAEPHKTSIYSHAQQIQFAIENYLIRSGTIYDRALIFVNHLLDLGIVDESIQHNVLITNTHVERYGLKKYIKDLSSACRQFSFERNSIIHHRSYSSDEFDKFSLIITADAMAAEVGKESPFTREMIDTLTDAVLNEHIDAFTQHLDKIKLKLNDLLDHAIAVYKVRRMTYSQAITAEVSAK